MARIRTIKPEFSFDEELSALPYVTRLFYLLSWCHVDKAGRAEDKPVKLRALIFPYEPGLDAEDIIQQLSPKFIKRYEVNGKRYIQIANWEKHQRPHHTEVESVIPCLPKTVKGEATVKQPLKDGGITDGKEGKGRERKGKDIAAKPPARTLTGVQKVMRGFKEAKGINSDDAAWDKKHFKRFARAATEVLGAFNGNADAAIIYVLKKGQEFDDKQMIGWGLDAIARSAATDQRVLEFNRGEHGSQDGEVGKDSLSVPGSGGGPTRAGDLARDALRAIEHATLHREGPGDVAGDGHDGAGD